ncbi:MAG: ferrochelatase [Bacteroidia bacterium]|nr:ferrochelatase [Sphingobacteriaceae bacterium]MBK7312231.1 ferrochelatase [Sphingobacteriaceae bacterium]MBK7816948.1 ferrochelatase [Sphingobacteriaceae bacterium]MBP9069207.1 ferrochelatase [Bacteroidia bacterium]
MSKEAIFLINLGTPDDPTPGKVGKYLTQFLNDKRVIDINPIGRFILVNCIIVPFRSFRSSKLYQAIWSKEGSPLLLHSIDLKNKLQQIVSTDTHVELAMRYQTPSIKNALENLRKLRPEKIHIIPLYPQYASSSTGSTLEEVLNRIKSWEVIPNLNIISKFYDHPKFIEALVNEAKNYDLKAYDHILFSYHGLPERQILKGAAHYGNNTCQMGDCCNKITANNRYCYRANSMETTRQLVKALNIPEGKYTSSFQSRLDDKWLKPYSDKVVAELAKKGAKNILVFSPAFVADCLETIYEIGTEYQEIFHANGGEKITLVKSLNSSDAWVKAVKEITLSN